MPELLSPAEKTRIFLLRKTSSPLTRCAGALPKGESFKIKPRPVGEVAREA